MDLEQLTINIFAEKILTQFDSGKYVDWAIDLMELGYESENLFILAGLDNELTQIREEYFWKTINDLKININKTDNELIQHYTKFVAQKVINHKIDIENAFRIMLRICSTTGYDERYIAFYEIDEDLDYLFYDNSTLFNSGLTKENKNKYIKQEFNIYYEMEENNIPLEKRNLWFCVNCEYLNEPTLKAKYQIKTPHKYQVYCCSNCGSENFDKDKQKVKRLIIKKYK